MNCPHCRCVLADRPDLAGMTFACPQCGGPFTIPAMMAPLATMQYAPPQVATQQGYDLSVHQVRAPHTTVHVNVPRQRSNSLGTASMILGVLSLFTCWLPFFGMPLSALGLLLGVIGMFVSIMRGGSGLGMTLAGSFVSGLVLLISFAFWGTIFAGAAAISEEAQKRGEAERSSLRSSIPNDTGQPSKPRR